MVLNIEERVLSVLQKFFNSNDFSCAKILACVSGGADSLALLYVLHGLSVHYKFSLEVVTIDHKIRSEEESGGDAQFVEVICASLQPALNCTRVNLEEGEVLKTAFARKKGIEEAARYLRYRIFDSLAQEKQINCICTAHNQNDQIETVLMRFLQGAGTDALGGIKEERALYLRPFLAVSRQEIETWLVNRGLDWREDNSNSDEAYTRNKIRRSLIPFLDQHFAGWQKGVLTTAEKAREDEKVLEKMPLPAWTHQDNVFTENHSKNQSKLKTTSERLCCDSRDFYALEHALRLRFIKKGLLKLKVQKRISYSFLKKIIETEDVCRFSAQGITFTNTGSLVLLGFDIVLPEKNGYLVYVTQPSSQVFPFGSLEIAGTPKDVRVGSLARVVSLPITIRSRWAGDALEKGLEIGANSIHDKGQTKILKKTSIKKLYSDWNVQIEDRDLIPIIEKNGKIQAVYGSLFGYPDWISEE